MMTIEEFRATRREVPNLAAEVYDTGGDLAHRRGYVYAGDVYMTIEDDGRISLQLSNWDWCEQPSELPVLEERLYEWAQAEALDGLSIVWSYYINDTDAPEVMANDHLPARAWSNLDAAKRAAYRAMCDVFDGPEPEVAFDSDSPEHADKQYVPKPEWKHDVKAEADGSAPAGSYRWDVYGDSTFIVVVYFMELRS